jgi:hypothetical protein
MEQSPWERVWPPREVVMLAWICADYSFWGAAAALGLFAAVEGLAALRCARSWPRFHRHLHHAAR